MAIILGLGALSAASYGAATAVRTWNAYQEEKAKTPEPEQNDENNDTKKASKEEEKDEPQPNTSNNNNDDDGPRENIFTTWFGAGQSNYYEGGFEDTMTRREAALILGVRESSSVARVKDAHRKLLILNHPDTGGSTYMAGKINAAKELLLKGRKE